MHLYKVIVSGFLDKEIADFFAEQVKKTAPESLKVEVDDYYHWEEDEESGSWPQRGDVK